MVLLINTLLIMSSPQPVTLTFTRDLENSRFFTFSLNFFAYSVLFSLSALLVYLPFILFHFMSTYVPSPENSNYPLILTVLFSIFIIVMGILVNVLKRILFLIEKNYKVIRSSHLMRIQDMERNRLIREEAKKRFEDRMTPQLTETLQGSSTSDIQE